MAAKQPAPQPMVLLEFQYQKFVLPMDKGMEVFAALAGIEPVEYDYTNKVWKYSTSSSPPTMRMFTVVEQASLALSTSAE